MKNIIKIIGKTIDDKIVFQGLFQLIDQEGLPIEIILEICKNKNMIPDWINFYQECLNHGWKHKTIINKLDHALLDIYGLEFRNLVINKLKEKFKCQIN